MMFSPPHYSSALYACHRFKSESVSAEAFSPKGFMTFVLPSDHLPRLFISARMNDRLTKRTLSFIPFYYILIFLFGAFLATLKEHEFERASEMVFWFVFFSLWLLYPPPW